MMNSLIVRLISIKCKPGAVVVGLPTGQTYEIEPDSARRLAADLNRMADTADLLANDARTKP